MFMKVFLERQDIHLSKLTVHKYMNKEMKLKSICQKIQKRRYPQTLSKSSQAKFCYF